jgi:HEAT repeat protein
VRRGAKEAVEESRAAGVVNMADFDTTLYFLDEREIEYLQDEVKREYEQDLRQNVIAMLLDIFETQRDPVVRAEVMDHLDTLLVYMLAASHFRGVAFFLREIAVAQQRAPELSTEESQRLAEIPARLSAPESLSQLLQALDDAPSLPPQDELLDLFQQFRPVALATIFQWLGRIQNSALKPLLEDAAGRLAATATSELVRLILVPEREIAAEAIRRAGALKTQAAVAPLAKLLSDADAEMRLAAVRALQEIASPGALQSLERAVDDEDREVRIAAVRALGARGYKPVLPRVETRVKGKAIREADLTEKMAFFETYGALCGDGGVSYLDGILNGKGFLGRREDAEVRACAAVALGRVASPLANDSLRRASSEKDVVVRNAVNRALRGATS